VKVRLAGPSSDERQVAVTLQSAHDRSVHPQAASIEEQAASIKERSANPDVSAQIGDAPQGLGGFRLRRVLMPRGKHSGGGTEAVLDSEDREGLPGCSEQLSEMVARASWGLCRFDFRFFMMLMRLCASGCHDGVAQELLVFGGDVRLVQQRCRKTRLSRQRLGVERSDNRL
jgi:hypothetical protein